MSQNNWNIIGAKLRDYEPAVDAEVAWQSALAELESTPPAALSPRRLLAWKGGEAILLLLFVWCFAAGPAPEPDRSGLDRTELAATARAPAKAPFSSTKATPPRPDAAPAAPTPNPPIKRARTTTTTRLPRMDAAAPVLAGKDRIRGVDGAAPYPLDHRQPRSSSAALAAEPPARVVVPTLPARSPGSLSRTRESIFATVRPAPAAAPVSASRLEVEVGWNQPALGNALPYVGLQLSLPAGRRGEIVLGAGYQNVAGLDLYWQQAEYHKDFGYPTGNAVERWLDNYGAWEYRLGYRHRPASRWAFQTDLQLTILQERGLRERVRGDEFFLGSSRRSLVDRDFGLRFGVDYQLTSRFGLSARYLLGLGDITPDYIYGEEHTDRHGGMRVGLRLMLF